MIVVGNREIYTLRWFLKNLGTNRVNVEYSTYCILLCNYFFLSMCVFGGGGEDQLPAYLKRKYMERPDSHKIKKVSFNKDL